MKSDEIKKYSLPLVIELGDISQLTFGAQRGPGDSNG